MFQVQHMDGKWEWGQFQITEATALSEAVKIIISEGDLKRLFQWSPFHIQIKWQLAHS